MAYLLLVLTTLFWSGNFVLARAMHLEMPPVSMAFWRWFVALLILLPWVLPTMWRQHQLIKTHFPYLLLLAVLGVANFNTFVYQGLQITTALNAALLQSAIPIVILVLSSLVLKLKVTIGQCLGIMVSMSGVFTIVSQGNLDTLLQLQINRGDAWILGAVLTWALYSIALKWRPENLQSNTLLGVTVLMGVLVLLPFYLWEQKDLPAIQWHQDNLLMIGYMALFPSVLAYFFWNRGVAELGAAKAGLFIHLMPVFGLILSVIFLGESVRAFHLLGIGLIFSGIYLATKMAMPPKK
ncbi:MAG: DMT family transporter [Motiliproteus sp.]|nr:DMT family transporter [Motiliproteus sp.]MCW9051037.1 DMT family transporter [Motiliproteus sp.]